MRSESAVIFHSRLQRSVKVLFTYQRALTCLSGIYKCIPQIASSSQHEVSGRADERTLARRHWHRQAQRRPREALESAGLTKVGASLSRIPDQDVQDTVRSRVVDLAEQFLAILKNDPVSGDLFHGRGLGSHCGSGTGFLRPRPFCLSFLDRASLGEDHTRRSHYQHRQRDRRTKPTRRDALSKHNRPLATPRRWSHHPISSCLIDRRTLEKVALGTESKARAWEGHVPISHTISAINARLAQEWSRGLTPLQTHRILEFNVEELTRGEPRGLARVVVIRPIR
jgi:hypothetical protein